MSVLPLAVRLVQSPRRIGLAACAGCGINTSPARRRHAGRHVRRRSTPRVDLKAGLMDAGEAVFGLKVDAKAVSPTGFLGHHQLRPRVRRQLRDPGELQRPGDLGHDQSVIRRSGHGVQCPASQNDVSVYKNLMFMSAEAFNGRVDCKPSGSQPATGEQGPDARRSHLRHQRHQEPEARRQRADVPRLAHAHAARGSERQGQRLHLRVRFGGDPARRASSRDASATRRTRTRTRRSCASRSSRCRWRTRSRPRS